MEPLSQILADNPPKYQKTFEAIIPDSSFKNNSMNAAMSRAGSLMIFVSYASGNIAGSALTCCFFRSDPSSLLSPLSLASSNLESSS